MKKLLPAVLILLLVPLSVHAQNSLDEAKNLNNALNSGGNGSAGYIQDQYLGGASNNNTANGNNAGAGKGGSGGAAIGGATAAAGSGLVAGSNAASVGAAKVKNEAFAAMQAETDLRAKRQKSITLYCLAVLAAAIAAAVALQALSVIPQVKLAVMAVFATLVFMGFVRLFKSYPDGVNPSSGTKVICSFMLASVPLLLLSPGFGVPTLILGIIGLTQNKSLADAATRFKKSGGTGNKSPASGATADKGGGGKQVNGGKGGVTQNTGNAGDSGGAQEPPSGDPLGGVEAGGE